MSFGENYARASLFFFDGHISIAASVISTATELVRRGYKVDIYYNCPSSDLPPPAMPQGVTLHEHKPLTRWLLRPIMDLLRQRKLKDLSKIKADDTVRKKSVRIRAMVKALIGLIEVPQFALYCRRQAKPTELAIAFDMTSLLAMDYALPRNIPFVYWSLEIWLLSDLIDPFSRMMKRHELRRLPQAKAVVVQLQVRRALIERDLAMPLANYVEVPNAPCLPMPPNLKADFYSSRFPIPADAWVVLHSGFISAMMLSLEIAETVPGWPEGFILIFHERQQRDPQESYIQAIKKAGGDRVFLSLNPVPYDEVDNVYIGADIGIVCYQTADPNDATSWASSGKLVFYLRHGLPIVMVTPECPSLIEEWQCGVWTTDVSGIGAALTEIATDYDGYSARARKTYEALYDFTAAFDRLMEKICGVLPRNN